jgi:hypothetical protein
MLFPTAIWVMTAGFLFVGPFAVGWITAATGTESGENRWASWIFLPWFAILLADLCLFVVGLEGWICIVFAIPITLVMSSLGGIAGGLIAVSRFRQKGVATLCVAVLPLLLAGLEQHFDGFTEIRTVETTILIHAPAPVIWANVASVPPIRHDELTPTWTHAIGFPLPIAATLDREGVGGVRRASFEHGLVFLETINDWQPLHQLTFRIKADTADIPPATLDEHVTIGGRFFDVIDGQYRLEPLANGDTLLHLTSHERLSTDFNAYAALWTDAVMRDLQASILEVVKHRCEHAKS